MAALPGITVALGNPPSSDHQMSQLELADWMTEFEALAGSSGLSYIDGTLASLEARVGTADGEYGLVINELAEAGVYERVAGSWVKKAAIPSIFTDSDTSGLEAEIAAQQEEIDTIGRGLDAIGAPDYRDGRVTADGNIVVETDLDGKFLRGVDPHSGATVVPGVVDATPAPYRDGYAHGQTPVLFSEDAVVASADADGLNVPYRSSILTRRGAVMLAPALKENYVEGLMASRDGFTALCRQRTDAPEPTEVCVDPRPMHFTPTSGQSNALNGGGANRRKVTGPRYPNHLLGMAASGAARFITSAGSTFDPSLITGLLPYQEFASASLGAGSMPQLAVSIEAAYREFGAPSPGVICYTSGVGGSPLTDMNQGTQIYANVILAAEAALAAAAKYDRDVVCHALHFVQGEGGPYPGYQALLETLGDDYAADLTAALAGNGGIDPVLLIEQIALSDTNAGTGDAFGVTLDQVAAARNRPDIIKLAGPMYVNFMDPVNGIHGSSESKAVWHAAAGYAYRQLVETGDWEPLWSVDGIATRTGDEIVIVYNVPGVDGELHFDPGVDFPEKDGWIKPVANYGFHYADDSSGVTIASVALEADPVGGVFNRVRITLTGDPGAATGKTLTYAAHAFDTTQDRWSSARGQLRCRLGPSPFWREGLAVPRLAYSYAIAEKWSV